MKNLDNGARQYITPFPLSHAQARCTWPREIGSRLAGEIIQLIRATTKGTPVIGFAAEIKDSEGARYIDDLCANLAAQKCWLLEVRSSEGSLIGLCTVRRNLNPNNSHIGDLSKGMIDQRYRGGTVLPAAFLEISAQCQANGVEILTLDVRAGTRALRIWQHYGFETYGVMLDYARSNGESFAGHFMTQKVTHLKARAIREFARESI
jgi:hypothetical protein